MKTLLLTICLSGIAFLAHAQIHYCTAHTTSLHAHHQLQYFQFDSLIHVTSNTPTQEYTDYSATHTINTKLGGKHLVWMAKEQNPNQFTAGNPIGFTIWIDFNNDFIFAGNEMVYTHYSSSRPTAYAVKDTLIFPANATTGLHRLRVRTGWGSAPTSACGYTWGGGTVDYTINIAAGSTALHVPEEAKYAALRF